MRRNKYLVIGIILTATLLTSFGLIRYSGQWRKVLGSATCIPNACFCEAIRPSGPAQPADTWSSLAFVVAAVVLFARGSKDDDHTLAARRVFCVSLVAIGLSSAFYHSTLTFVGQILDVSGMYLLGSFALLMSINEHRKLSSRQFMVTYMAANAALLVAQVFLPITRRVIFAMVIAAILALELPRNAAARTWRRRNRYLLGSLAVFGAAFIIWILDITRVVCNPGSWFQGHAAWHVLGAMASMLLFEFYRGRVQPEPRTVDRDDRN